jgi:hypothetical protein
MYAALPILLPTFMSLAILRLSRDSRRSSKRIKLLETSDSSESAAQRLMHVLREMEKQMEDAVAEMVDADPGRTGDSTPTLASPGSAPSPAAADSTSGDAKKREQQVAKKKGELKQPVLTPLQLQLIENLNRLPGLKKERAWIDPVRHSHAIIVCRDVKRFEGHREGEGVLRHWADHFVM